MVKAFLVETPALNLFKNMAVDEALFLGKNNVLRFYQWERPSYSIGYFQKISQSPNDLPLVRRLTGGGTVRHEQDLTFSLVMNIQDFPGLKVLEDSYYLIHQGVLKGLRKEGIRAEILESALSGANAFCFQAPVRGDLLFENQKILGGAQRRRGGRLLYQGTLQMSESPLNHELKSSIADGLKNIFGLEYIKKDDILSEFKSTIEKLEEKYQSENWLNRF